MNHLNINQKLPHAKLSSLILGCCFEVMNELGVGFLESVYKNALFFALKEKRLLVEVEKSFEVYFKGKRVGVYRADIVVESSVIVELKCCKMLLPEHQAQVINYLSITNLPVGLLINFNDRQLDYKRVHHPMHYPAAEGDPVYPVNC
jgi:GxxExxY protein